MQHAGWRVARVVQVQVQAVVQAQAEFSACIRLAPAVRWAF
jgi:hypothetical protein